MKFLELIIISVPKDSTEKTEINKEVYSLFNMNSKERGKFISKKIRSHGKKSKWYEIIVK